MSSQSVHIPATLGFARSEVKRMKPSFASSPPASGGGRNSADSMAEVRTSKVRMRGNWKFMWSPAVGEAWLTFIDAPFTHAGRGYARDYALVSISPANSLWQ